MSKLATQSFSEQQYNWLGEILFSITSLQIVLGNLLLSCEGFRLLIALGIILILDTFLKTFLFLLQFSIYFFSQKQELFYSFPLNHQISSHSQKTPTLA
jgi:hypothetical protein